MKTMATLLLGILVLAPGIVAAGEGKPAQEKPAVAAAREIPRKLDLNRVSAAELVGVPGIGPSTAQAIVDLRSKKGAFTRVEELLEVTGIKERKLAALAAYLEVIPHRANAAATPAVQAK